MPALFSHHMTLAPLTSVAVVVCCAACPDQIESPIDAGPPWEAQDAGVNPNIDAGGNEEQIPPTHLGLLTHNMVSGSDHFCEYRLALMTPSGIYLLFALPIEPLYLTLYSRAGIT
jgi:hypothetical protein